MTQAIYFDGSGDYLIANANSGSFGTADFTVEAFVKSGGGTNEQCIINFYNTYNANSFAIYSNRTSYTNRYSIALGGTGFPNMLGSIRASSNSFDHVAVTRQGNTITLYVNGNRDNTACTFTGNLTHSSGNTWIGTDGSAITSFYYRGWINGLRIIKNECLYTANFTPPTILTVTPNTTLLTCNVLALNSNNHCIDQSNLGYSITTVGDVGLANSGDLISVSDTIQNNFLSINTGPEYVFANVFSYQLNNDNIEPLVEFGGDGIIYGKLKKRITNSNVDLPNTKVFLYTQKNKQLLLETTSNTTGDYIFSGLNKNEKFYIMSFDPVAEKNAVIADNITPV